MGILGTPLGWIMKWIYDFLFHFNIAGAYGWALVLFILLTKLLTYPLSVKQQKSTARMAAFQPKLKQLEKQYGKDKNRYQQEMMKLYEEEGINPMNGCLPMMVTFLLLFGIIDVIYNPLKHLLQVPADLIQEATQILGRATSTAQLEIISAIQNGSTAYDGLFDGSIMEQIQNFDMNFLGFNMGEIPNQVWGLLVIIPIVSFLTQIVSTLVSMKVQEKNGQKMQGGMKWFMLAMPLMSLWIAFTLPAGVGFYWIVSNLLMILQTLLLAKLYPPEKVAAMSSKSIEKTRAKMRKKREQMEIYQKRMEEKGMSPVKAAASAAQHTDRGNEHQKEKELAKSRLAEARRKMAEKYGDDYKED